ncbi:hypothetical protein [Luteolibacter sp. Populi]|uniref:hypothetical protein n=1 Tax=Luteolibacter sp. Populi TaxID=3230487 RepID=UPI003465FEAA
MSFSSNYAFLSMLSIAAQVAFATLAIWIAVIVLRQRTAAAWMVLAGAILSPAITLFATFGRRLIGSSPDFEFHMWIYFTGNIVAQLLFLGGLLLHLMRRSSESERITELEAIIHDRDQGGEARVNSP